VAEPSRAIITRTLSITSTWDTVCATN